MITAKWEKVDSVTDISRYAEYLEESGQSDKEFCMK